MVANPKEYLRASNGDGPAVRAWLSDDREVGDMSVIVDSVLNWPTKFVATIGTLNSDGSVTETTVFLGHLEGSIVMIEEFAPGYFDEGNSEGQVAFIKPASAWADIIAEMASQPSLPSGGTAGQILTKVSSTDGDAEWEDAPETGSLSIIPKEIPSGDVDGSNTEFVTLNPYVGGSLQVYINGLAQSGFATETDPATGEFELDVAPLTGDDIRVYYHFAPTVTNNADALDGYHLSGILDILFPIGCHWDGGESDVLPPLLASIGTWERFKGRVVVGVDEAQTEFNTTGKTGGAKTHELTAAENGPHTHVQYGISGPSGSGAGYLSLQDDGNLVWYRGNGTTWASGGGKGGTRPKINVSASETRNTSSSGSGNGHNNLQPYEATYMWKRIA